MNFLKLACIFLTLVISATLNVSAQSQTAGSLEITNPIIRLAPPNAPVSAGYLSITNKGEKADHLIAVSAQFSGKAEVHEMKMDDGVMKMRQLDNGIEIASGETVILKPGGYHIMFMMLNMQMVKDETHIVKLMFENAGEMELEFTVGAYDK